ncbi:uncharacterized protein [Haliotis cracherodii]|uniref:uncharacterized protein n=1 Tax=Haliotis cracherodii TaxID=6455 RepID=UPI0039E87370
MYNLRKWWTFKPVFLKTRTGYFVLHQHYVKLIHGNSVLCRGMYFLINPTRNVFKFPDTFEQVDNLKAFKVRTVRGGSERRPELIGYSEDIYDEDRSAVYTQSERMQRIQTELTRKAIELLEHTKPLSTNPCVLDIGSGSGISSAILKKAGYFVVGTDSNTFMLSICKHKVNSQDCVKLNMFYHLPFRASCVGTVVSISALQWIYALSDCHRYMGMLFSSLHDCLDESGRGVLQFYPRMLSDVENTLDVAQKYFPHSALVCDFPHSHRGKKIYLILIK